MRYTFLLGVLSPIMHRIGEIAFDEGHEAFWGCVNGSGYTYLTPTLADQVDTFRAFGNDCPNSMSLTHPVIAFGITGRIIRDLSDMGLTVFHADGNRQPPEVGYLNYTAQLLDRPLTHGDIELIHQAYDTAA